MRILFLILIFLSGCDKFPVEKAISEFDEVVNLSISYSDGNTFVHDWRPCQVYLLGASNVGRWGMEVSTGISVTNIKIVKENNIVHEYGINEITSFFQRINDSKTSMLIADDGGIRVSSESRCRDI